MNCSHEVLMRIQLKETSSAVSNEYICSLCSKRFIVIIKNEAVLCSDSVFTETTIV
jgi:hypothetical protein